MSYPFNKQYHPLLFAALLIFLSYGESVFAATWSVFSKNGATPPTISAGSSVVIQGTAEFDAWLGIAPGTYLSSVFIEGSPCSVPLINAVGTLADQSSSGESIIPIRKTGAKWFMQLLPDNTGVKLHRFQILTSTLILGGIFVAEMIKSLTMHTFSASLLDLLDISSSTYLGFKLPEL
jgi:hypothetical protein